MLLVILKWLCICKWSDKNRNNWFSSKILSFWRDIVVITVDNSLIIWSILQCIKIDSKTAIRIESYQNGSSHVSSVNSCGNLSNVVPTKKQICQSYYTMTIVVDSIDHCNHSRLFEILQYTHNLTNYYDKIAKKSIEKPFKYEQSIGYMKWIWFCLCVCNSQMKLFFLCQLVCLCPNTKLMLHWR